MIVVANAGPLISLGKLNRIYLLKKLYRTILISKEVYREVVIRGLERGHIDGFRTKQLIDRGIIRIVDKKFDTKELEEDFGIDKGEAETISLFIDKKADLVLIDNLHARICARSKNLRIKGTIGVLFEAYKKKIIYPDEFELLMNEIMFRNDIWIHEEICKKVLERVKG